MFPELDDVLNAFKKEEVHCSANWQQLQVYEMLPSEFLSFARRALEDGSERGRLDAISNASRAIACRVDQILSLSSLRGFMATEGWNLPYKLQVIKKLGCPAPYVLRGYITSIRNVLEHEYKRPPEPEQIRYVADIAELFLSATDKYVAKGHMRSVRVEVKEAEERQTQRSTETRLVTRGIFCLDFDFESGSLVVTYSRWQEKLVTDLRTAEVKQQLLHEREPVTNNLTLADCNKERLAELERAVRGKLEP